MGMGLRMRLGLGSGASALAIATFTSSDQRLMTNGSSNAITTSKPTALTYDGAALGSTTGSPATYNWTPGALDADVTLATADGATQKHMVVASSSQIVLPTGAGITSVTTGKQDIRGGTSAYEVNVTAGGATSLITYTATGRPTGANTGLEFEVSDPMKPTECDSIVLYDKVWLQWVNGQWQTGGGGGYYGTIYPVERKQTSDGVWMTRFWFRLEAGKVNDSSFLYFGKGFGDGDFTPATSGPIFRIGSFRYVDAVMNMHKWQRINVRDLGTKLGSTNVEQWVYLGPFQDGTALYDSATNYALNILRPTGGINAGTIPIIIPRVEPTQNVYSGELYGTGTDLGSAANQGFGYDQAYIDALNVVLVSADAFIGSWGGRAASGKHDHTTLFGQAIPNAMERYLGLAPGTKWGAFGWSKTAYAALYLRQMFPTRFSHVALYDAPWGNTYPNFLAGDEFENQATYDAYDPYANLAALKATLNDQTRIILGTGDRFVTEYGAMKTLLNAQGVPYRDKGNLSAGLYHNFYSAWGKPMLTDLVAAMRGTL